jgi:peptidoglycan/LPS O-acetylase OafA/YrhL
MSPRRFDIDLVKAVGIVAVVLIHSMRPFFSAESSRAELWLGSATQFAVPGFLAASGVLAATSDRIPAAVTRARLHRLLVPYLLASGAAQLFLLGFEGRTPSLGAACRDLLLAASFGPYYYVLHALLFALAAPLFARLRVGGIAAATGAALVAQWLFWSVWLLPLFWMVRNPLYWLGFFLAGWCLRRAEPRLTPWLERWRVPVCLASGAGAAAALVIGSSTTSLWLSGPAGWLKVVCMLAFLFGVGWQRETRAGAVRFLSDSTYTIYLFHLFFVYPAQRLVPAAPGVFDPVAIGAAWGAGLAGPLLLAALGRAALGARSRTLLGS